MATLAPRSNPWRFLLEPLRGMPLVAAGLLVWIAGAAYCHGYERLLAGAAEWPGSLTWSAIAVLPWFALFEWSKQHSAAATTRRPLPLVGLVAGIAALSIGLEYLVNYCLGDVTDRFGLLVMRRMPAVGVTILLIALTRRAVLQRPPDPDAVPLSEIAPAIEWVAAADNYVELHSGNGVSLRRMTMARADGILRRHGFVRIHRRYLVNRNKIVEVRDRFVRLTNGEELPIGSAFASNLRR